MGFEKPMRCLNRALVCLTCVLVVCYIALLTAGPPKVSVEAGNGDARATRENQAFSTPRLTEAPMRYANLFAGRQLFRHLVAEQRRPLETDEAEHYKLLGITFDGNGYQAHVFEERSETYHTFREGQYMGEYLIESVDRNRVLLVSGEERLELKK